MADNWKKLKILGSGSFGTVSLAGTIDPFGHPTSFAAIKSTFLETSDSLKLEAKLLHEFKGHPNVVQCFGEDISLENCQKTYNLLLEYASGGTLETLIKSCKGSLPENLIALYSYQLLKGIAYIHSKGIVHCDIKPCNILVFPNQGDSFNRLKIADFGLAIINDPRKRMKLRGTLDYASPESVQFGEHGSAADIWSFGCTVLNMFKKTAWRFYYDTDDLKERIITAMPEIPESISDLAKDFLRNCLEKESSRRFPAKLLMFHPFIGMHVQGIKALVQEGMACSPRNPFGYGGFVSTQGLFGVDVYEESRDGGYYDHLLNEGFAREEAKLMKMLQAGC